MAIIQQYVIYFPSRQGIQSKLAIPIILSNNIISNLIIILIYIDVISAIRIEHLLFYLAHNTNSFIILMYEEPTYFAQELEQISQIYIKTSFGNIFAQAVGKFGQPLIIVVHGSGPRNSSDQYAYFLHEYLVRVSYIQKFFIIAIDCPGYGRSKGSKEAIKTFPLQMFREILKDLNYKNYFAMFGHSQGGAAIFNSVYEDPSLTQFLLMDRPVCGNIKRFQKFPLPTLLVYDIQDDGHPIWQGKQLYKSLITSQLYTYRDTRDPYYVPDNIWNLILSFIRRYTVNRKGMLTSSRAERSHNQARSLGHKKNSSLSKEKKKQQEKEQKKQREEYEPRSNRKFKKQKNLSMDKYLEIKKEKEREAENIMAQIPEIDRSEVYSRVADLQQFEDLPIEMNQPKIEESPEQAKKYEMKKKQKMEVIKIKEKEIEMEKVKEKMEEKKQQKKEKKNQKEEKKEEKEKKERKSSEDTLKCSICIDILYEPIETNCKHVFCKKCIGQSYLVDPRCPLCRTKITSRKVNEKLKKESEDMLSQAEKAKKQQQLHKFEQMLKNIVYIEIGNNSKQLPIKQSAFSKIKKKYMWEVYAKEPKNFKFEQVHFNINMGERDAKPIKVTHAPFVFESRGTFSFSCQITIKPKNKDYAPIISVYRIDVSPGNHSKIIALKKKRN